MNSYNSYKNSGIEWIGMIPSHWSLKKLKYLAKILNGQDHKSVWNENGQYPIIGTGGEFGRADRYLHPGPSVILGRKGTIDKPQYIHGPFWSVDTAYFTDIYPETDSRFFFYLCNTILFNMYKYGSAVPSMTQETLNNIFFATPSKSEQTAIASYLDEKTSQIDELIAKKQRLIELLKEERNAVINEALSGEGKNWERKKLKHVLNSMYDTEHKTVPFFEDGEYCVARTSDIKNGTLIFEKMKKTDYYGYQEWTKRAIPEFEDILFTREAPAGEACVVPINLQICLGQRMVLLKVNKEKLIPQFLVYLIYSDSIKNYINNLSQGSTVSHLNMGDIPNIPILLPCLEDQMILINNILEETNRIDLTLTKVEREIELMKEYRTALISEVVTGKIKVP